MLDDLLLQLRTEIETHLLAMHPRDRDWIRLSNLVTRDGAVAPDTDDAIVMTVASIHSDPAARSATVPAVAPGGITAAAPVFLDVHLTFASTYRLRSLPFAADPVMGHAHRGSQLDRLGPQA